MFAGTNRGCIAEERYTNEYDGSVQPMRDSEESMDISREECLDISREECLDIAVAHNVCGDRDMIVITS